MNIIQLITAFGGGMLGAAIGGVPAFVFTGLTVIIAIFAGESGMPVIGTLSFGSVFGPHVAFGGAVAAAALAKKKGCAIIETINDTMNTARVITDSYSVDQIMTTDIITFNENDLNLIIRERINKMRKDDDKQEKKD